MSEVNKQLVRRHFEEIFNRKNLAASNDTVAEEYIEHAVAPFGRSAPGKVAGPEHMRATAEWLHAQFPDLHMTIEAIVAEGDAVAVRILGEGTNLGPLNGVIPPTGKHFSAYQTHWFRVEDGKLVEHWPTERIFQQCCSLESFSHQADHRSNRSSSSPWAAAAQSRGSLRPQLPTAWSSRGFW